MRGKASRRTGEEACREQRWYSCSRVWCELCRLRAGKGHGQPLGAAWEAGFSALERRGWGHHHVPAAETEFERRSRLHRVLVGAWPLWLSGPWPGAPKQLPGHVTVQPGGRVVVVLPDLILQPSSLWQVLRAPAKATGLC